MTDHALFLPQVENEGKIGQLELQQECPEIRQSGWQGWGEGGLKGGTGGLGFRGQAEGNQPGRGGGNALEQLPDKDGGEELLADCEFGDWSQFPSSLHEAGNPILDQDERERNGAYFLKQIDPDFLCGPRMIVRGEYSGENNGTSFSNTLM